jgi:hypothetical protein
MTRDFYGFLPSLEERLGYGMDDTGFDSRQTKRFMLSITSGLALEPDSMDTRQRGRSLKFATSSYLAPIFRMRGTVPPLPLCILVAYKGKTLLSIWKHALPYSIISCFLKNY